MIRSKETNTFSRKRIEINQQKPIFLIWQLILSSKSKPLRSVLASIPFFLGMPGMVLQDSYTWRIIPGLGYVVYNRGENKSWK